MRNRRCRTTAGRPRRRIDRSAPADEAGYVTRKERCANGATYITIPRHRDSERSHAMPQWQVRNVMSTDVITAPADTPIVQIVDMLIEFQISGVPIVNEFDVVIGVVSWTDLHAKLEIVRPDRAGGRTRIRRRRRTRLRWSSATAVEVMSGSPLTIESDASLSAAGRLMHRRGVGRLLVVDRAGRLMGIVTRRDLLKVHGRLDPVIRDEVMQDVLRRTLMIEPGSVQASVDDGEVTLTGHTRHKTTALAAVGLTEAVAGVTGVVNHLTFETDDTGDAVVTAANHRPDHDPMHGFWNAARHYRQTADATNNHSLAVHAEQVTRTDAAR
jgi:CBS domain-containing protein